jgi:hypothetical protein
MLAAERARARPDVRSAATSVALWSRTRTLEVQPASDAVAAKTIEARIRRRTGPKLWLRRRPAAIARRASEGCHVGLAAPRCLIETPTGAGGNPSRASSALKDLLLLRLELVVREDPFLLQLRELAERLDLLFRERPRVDLLVVLGVGVLLAPPLSPLADRVARCTDCGGAC